MQDVSWFDLKEIAALPSEINDDLEKIQDAFGDKFGNGIMAFSAFVGLLSDLDLPFYDCIKVIYIYK